MRNNNFSFDLISKINKHISMRGIKYLLIAIAIATTSTAFSRSQSLPSGSGSSDNPMNPGNGSGYSSGNSGSGFTGAFSSGSNGDLASAASSGIGKTAATNFPACYRAVKRIIAKGLGKDENCVRRYISGGIAINALSALPRAGFRNDMSKCKQPGAVMVYSGRRVAGYRGSAGDSAGHIEVVGDDGGYHSFYTGLEPISETMPGRRILAGCFVLDESAYQSSPVSKCPAWNGPTKFNGNGKRKRRGRS